MKMIIATMAALTISAFVPVAAFAACPETTGSISNDAKTGISKDGTRAPLQTDTQSATTPQVNPNPTKKDGNTMPLADQEGGGNKNLATSQQDVEAQQKGDKTAAAEADDACKD
ncbi:hypothetical protein [Mesorhizobium sp. YR577]|uniref:hypothetical protein n=1 Tax=Mesorhizobium sp. YR577 TaxID=1884373 RepID=UPI001587250B|nr:hypothetical protein [Mesorhizobium sp. YR577]